MICLAACPSCNWPGYFGPAAFVFVDTGVTFWYVNCKRCGELYLVRRDAELSGRDAP